MLSSRQRFPTLNTDVQRPPRKLGGDVPLAAQCRQPLSKRMHIDPRFRRDGWYAPDERSRSAVGVQEQEEVQINAAPHSLVVCGLRIHN